LMLRSDRTPFGSISSRIVYLHKNIIKNKLQQQREHHNHTQLNKPVSELGNSNILGGGLSLPQAHLPLQYTIPLLPPFPFLFQPTLNDQGSLPALHSA
jgi:hypothetical protein